MSQSHVHKALARLQMELPLESIVFSFFVYRISIA